MVAWPVIMLGTFALRTFSKPIANYLAKEALGHPKIRQHVINIAQANQRFKVRVQRRIYDYVADGVPIQPSNEHKAVGSGVDLLKEIFAFTVAGSAVIFKVSEARKEEERLRQEDELLEQEIELLREYNELLEQEIELLREYNELLRERLQLIRELKRQKNKLVRQELHNREDNELFGELFGEELQAINLKQNFFEEKDGEHEEKLDEIKQLATFGFILILMHTHGNEGRKSKSN